MKRDFIALAMVLLVIMVPMSSGYENVLKTYSSIFSKFFSIVTGKVVGDSRPGDSSWPSTGPGSQQECDLDSDSYLSNSQICHGNDCNDNNANVNPGATEVCDNLDNNCNGQTDEGVINTCSSPGIIPGQACTIWMQCGTCPYNPSESGNALCDDEIDNDCDSAIDCADPGCDASDVCGGSNCQDSDSDGYFNLPDCGTQVDCNDNDGTIHPNAIDLPCDGIDQNCNGQDNCGEGGTTPGTSNQPPGQCIDPDNDGVTNCSNPPDCNNNDPAIKPGLSETCNDAKDNDCDGSIDEGCTNLCANSPDDDGDNYNACQDCNDDDASVHPGRDESCTNGVDDDCDNTINEGCVYCGNNDCQSPSETCSSCPQDCGACPSIGGTQARVVDRGLGEETSIEVAERLNGIQINLGIIEKTLGEQAEIREDPTLKDISLIAANTKKRVEEIKIKLADGGEDVTREYVLVNIKQIGDVTDTLFRLIS